MIGKRTVCLLGALLLPAFLGAEVILENRLDSDDSLKGWVQYKTPAKMVTLEDGRKAMEVFVAPEADGKGVAGAYWKLDVKKLAGRQLELTVDVKRDLEPPLVKWQGGKIMVNVLRGGTTDYPGIHIPSGKFDWTKMTLKYDVPSDAKNGFILMGIQSGKGRIQFRNLKVTAGDVLVDLKKSMNRGFVDKVAGDGKGGWSDQGPHNDASRFKSRRKTYANIPFDIVDPAKNNGNSVMVFKSSRSADGLEKAETDFSGASISGKYLYLLHTLTWGAEKPVTGFVILQGKNGKTQTIEVKCGRDVGDWWNPAPLANAFPAALWQNFAGGTVGVYASKFKLDAGLGELRKIEFRTANSIPTWLVLAATISDNDYKAPAQEKYVIKADKIWKELPMALNGIKEGSALDVSALNDHAEAGTYGRVAFNKNGEFTFEKGNGKPIRFFTSCELGNGFWQGDFETKASTENYVKQMRLQGYNMVRFHFIDSTLMTGSKKDFEFNEKFLDQFDYLIYCLKKNGIYVNIDAMASRIGYSAGYSWNAPTPQDPRFFSKDLFAADDSVRNHWKKGLGNLLNHKNPYTKTTLAKDPVLAMIVCFNEQEFVFSRDFDFTPMLPTWRKFLKEKYGTLDALKKAWGKDAESFTSFDSVPVFTQKENQEGKSRKNKDVARFVTKQMADLYNWYKTTLREIGYPGLVSNYNVGKTFRDVEIRTKVDAVTMNNYHAHPNGKSIDQTSSIANAGSVIRAMFSCRMPGKPFLITEHGHVFWNRYRYEQSFVTGAYSAFQNIGGMTAFCVPIQGKKVDRMGSFSVKNDPVAKSQEFLTTFLFLRGDVKSAPAGVRLRLDSNDFYERGDEKDGIDGSQSRFILTTGFTTDCDSDTPANSNEILMRRSGGSRVMNKDWEALVVDSKNTSFDFEKIVAELKKKKLLPADNKSSLKNEIYESSTGELLMDCNKNFMRIDTPRFQGVCGEAGTKAKLKNLDVEQMTARGNLSLVSIDGKAPISTSKRMVLAYATNALNSGMTFEDKDGRNLLDFGKVPVLWECGKFKVRIRNDNASSLKVYALGMDGSRKASLPVKKNGKTLEFEVDVAALPSGPAVYFELTAE